MEYVELHAHSCFSLCDGTNTPADLVARAANLGMPALALTDHNAVYGVVPFLTAAKPHGIQPVVGAELTLAGGYHLTLLVAHDRGWRNLCHLISQAQANALKGQAALPAGAFEGRTDGLICLSGCREGPVATALRRWDRTGAYKAAKRLRTLFGTSNTFIELQHHLEPEDAALTRDLVNLAQHLQLGYVATNNVHYAGREGHRLHDVLAAIRHRTALDTAGQALRGNSEYYLKPASRLLPLFRDYPEALIASTTIADRCRFDLTYGLQDLPLFPLPAGMDAVRYLADLCCQALPHRYPRDADSARRQLAYELRVIDQANLCNYFLIVWDLVHFARSHGIRCQGRGSAANSLVAYLLHISPVDPLAHDLVFERFLSAERPSLPDIDIDFDAARREEVIGYVFGRYGHDHAAMACTFSTFGARRALCDTARVLGIPPDTVRELTSQLAETVSHHDERLLRDLCGGLAGLPRHLGQHSGGMVITRAPLSERVATEPAAMAGRTVVQWDKDAIEEAGLVKIDILGLRMLAVLSECEQLLAEHGTPITLDALTFDDPAVYAILCRADTMGVFQVESRAQAQILPRLKPACFNDIILAISLIRPGPLQGNMVHPFLRRRMGIEPVMYPHPRLQAALAETLGVILFQEQVLKVARDLAGFSAGEGEQLRRALGGKQGHGRIATLRARFIAGAQVNGVASSAAEAVFAQLEAFGGYSFPKSHAAAFAVIVYQSAWLKHYYPATFLCALLNNQPMGFWPPAVLVRDAQRHGVVVLPLDIHTSGQRCTLEQTPNNGTVRLGLNYVIGLGEQGAQRILAARHVWPFADLAAFCRRTRLPRSLVGQLIDAGAFDGWGERRVLHWQLGMLRYEVEELDLPIPTEAVDLPQQSEGERYEQEMASTGVALGPHPIARWRAALDRRGFASSATLASIPMGQRVEVVGVCIIHQAPPTAKGFHFLTLEDELGMINTIVQPQLAQELGRQSSQTLRVQGVVQHEGAVTNLVALTIERVETS